MFTCFSVSCPPIASCQLSTVSANFLIHNQPQEAWSQNSLCYVQHVRYLPYIQAFINSLLDNSVNSCFPMLTGWGVSTEQIRRLVFSVRMHLPVIMAVMVVVDSQTLSSFEEHTLSNGRPSINTWSAPVFEKFNHCQLLTLTTHTFHNEQVMQLYVSCRLSKCFHNQMLISCQL